MDRTTIKTVYGTSVGGPEVRPTSGGFYSTPLDVKRGRTQGDIDSPIIFNLIIDAVIRSWKKDETYDGSRACFYADDGLIEHINAESLQQDLDTIIRLFNRIGLRANETKTKYMIVRGQAAPTALRKDIYNNIAARREGRRTTTYQQRRKQLTRCTICGKELQIASLRRHILRQHGTTEPQYQCREVSQPAVFTIESVTKGSFNPCPVTTCTGGGRDKFGLYRHFAYIHPEAEITIAEDGTLQKCDKCGMRCKNIQQHQKTTTCIKLSQKRKNEIQGKKQERADTVIFTINRVALERVKEFKYLGRILQDNDDDSTCIMENLKKARNRWNCIAKILKREGANAKCMSRFYMTVVQAVLLYGADSWTMTRRDMERMESFHKRAVRYMTGKHIRKGRDDKWEYPDHEKLLKECQLFPIDIYIQRRRGTLREYFMNYRRELLEEAMKKKRHCHAAHKVLWWEQPWMKKREFDGLTNLWFPP